MPDENSITIRAGKKWVNIPTVVRGRQLSEREAIQLFDAGAIRRLGQSFNSVDKAVAAAKARSDAKKGKHRTILEGG